MKPTRNKTNHPLTTEFKNKKAVLVAVPGAFTPTCQEQHVKSYLANLDKLRSQGVDQVIFIASNDHWVMSAWGKANGVKDDSIVSSQPCTLCVAWFWKLILTVLLPL